MAAGQAELIYVLGPQAGQRAALMSAVVTVGRGREADVQLTEQHVSRKHFRMMLTEDGWVFENLSPLKSRVNGKMYKVGKKIILDTGDVVSVGAETTLLFVSAGDDPEAAVIAYRQGGAGSGAPRTPAASPPTGAAAVATPGAGADQQTDALEQIEGARVEGVAEPEEEVELDEEQLAVLAQKAKIKKYGTVFAAYLGVIAILAVILASMSGPDNSVDSSGRPVRLKARQIADFITAPFPLRERNTLAAEKHLKKALLALDKAEQSRLSYLYEAVYYFKLARAYGRTLTTEEETKYNDTQNALVKEVQKRFRNAYLHELDHQYRNADNIFRQLLGMFPEIGRRGEKNELRRNIIAHLSFITEQLKRNKKR